MAFYSYLQENDYEGHHCGLEPRGWSFDSRLVINLLPLPFTDPFWEIKYFSRSGSGYCLDNFLKVNTILS